MYAGERYRNVFNTPAVIVVTVRKQSGRNVVSA